MCLAACFLCSFSVCKATSKSRWLSISNRNKNWRIHKVNLNWYHLSEREEDAEDICPHAFCGPFLLFWFFVTVTVCVRAAANTEDVSKFMSKVLKRPYFVSTSQFTRQPSQVHKKKGFPSYDMDEHDWIRSHPTASRWTGTQTCCFSISAGLLNLNGSKWVQAGSNIWQKGWNREEWLFTLLEWVAQQSSQQASGVYYITAKGALLGETTFKHCYDTI